MFPLCVCQCRGIHPSINTPPSPDNSGIQWGNLSNAAIRLTLCDQAISLLQGSQRGLFCIETDHLMYNQATSQFGRSLL